MRIAFVVNNYPPRVGGLEAHVQALASELHRRGHSVLVINLGEELGLRNDDGVEVLTLGERFKVGGLLGFPLIGTKRRIVKVLRQRDIEIVSVHTRFFPMSFVGWRAARTLGLPLIHTEHGSDYVASDSAIIRLGSKFVDHTLGRAVLRGADQVIGVSEEVTAFVRRLAGVDAEVFYNAINPPESSLKLAEDRPYRFVFVGRVVSGKGWDVYLELVARLRAAGFEVDGEVLGDGPDMPRLLEHVQRLDLSGVVTVRGRVSQEEVRSSLRGATLVNPTVLSEGFQTTMLEAIAERGRILTYPVPGATTLRDQGAPVQISSDRNLTGLFETAKAYLVNTPELANPELIDEWTWPRRADQYVRICTGVLPH